jgi:hypothetical protein
LFVARFHFLFQKKFPISQGKNCLNLSYLHYRCQQIAKLNKSNFF